MQQIKPVLPQLLAAVNALLRRQGADFLEAARARARPASLLFLDGALLA